MLESITLTNFRQFSDKTAVFGVGNTSLRGANEGGKSTIIEGLMYLLGGVKACRNNDFVTWGAKPSSCKVEARMLLQGTQVRATRGKSGAEIYVPHNADKPTITGQSEVTAWFAEQMGASLDVVAKMCFAGQKEIGGLLDEGNSKVVEFIEDMSGLDIVEFFIGKIQATGKVGLTTTLIERAQNDRAQLESQTRIRYADAIAAAESAIAPLEVEELGLTTVIASVENNLRDDRASLRIATQHASDLAAATRSAAKYAVSLDAAKIAVAAAETASGAARKDAAIEADLSVAVERQRDATDFETRRSAKTTHTAWPAPEAEWDEGLDSLKKFVSDNRTATKEAAAQLRENSKEIASLSQQRAVAESKKTTSSACGMCGKDVSEFPSVKETNTKIDDLLSAFDAEIQALTAKAAPLQAAMDEAEADAAAAQDILDAPTFRLALAHPDLFEIDHQYVPFRVKWIGGEVGEAPTDYTAEIAKLKAERSQLASLERAYALAVSTQASAAQSLEAAETELAALKKVAAEDEGVLSAKIAAHEAALAEKRLAALKLSERLGSQRSTLRSLRESESSHAAIVARLEAALAETEKDLALFDFHNQLIEDLRKARPAVASRLWNMVLLSVSTYLTRMRGEPSIVERIDKTFIINGRPYTSYSGSALDLLALGIRIALTKVFVPGADMLVLDEPFAACDADRTMQCLSFAAAAGFGQTIIITHEAGTESVFDHIVEV